MRPDPARDDFLESATTETAEQVRRYLVNKGACFLTNGIPRAINVTLLPTPVSRPCYQHLLSSQKPLNLLLELASRDTEFVIESVEPSTLSDKMAKCLLDIYRECADDPDQITLGLYRHDYMYHCSDPTADDAITAGAFKMVEANLMSAALLGIGTHVIDLHNQLMGKYLPGREQPYQRSLPGMVKGVYEAWRLYNRPQSIFLCLVAPGDFNWFDQQHMIDLLWEEYGIISIKMTYEEVMVEGELRDNRYYVRNREVAVFYFRSMYNEEHYRTKAHWETRLTMEKSRAIKVPNIRHQVMNLKLFQQVFMGEGVIERYLNVDDASLVRSTFAAAHKLAPGPKGDSAAQLAIEDPQGWVLKPSKEGGGNNIWENEMVKRLGELKDKMEREAFILMQRLNPPLIPNRFIKNGPHQPPTISDTMDTTTELGIFNAFVADAQGKVIFNEVAGPLLRSKPAAANEGGVAIGVGVMDSIVFYK